MQLFDALKLDVDFDVTNRNRGTAEIFFAAECWAFEACQADVLIIMEDDIIISPHYFAVMTQLASMACGNDRVGAFSAFGDASIPYQQQHEKMAEFVPLHHRWGAGMTRTFWNKVRADYMIYLDILKGYEYRYRPHQIITDFINSLNNAEKLARITSQDGVRTALMLHHGGFSFMCRPSYAINLGKRGMHHFPVQFQAVRPLVKGDYPFYPTLLQFPPDALHAQMDALTEQSIAYDYF